MEGEEVVTGGQKGDLDMTDSSKVEEQDHHEQTFGGSNEDGDYCRICRGEATDELPLYYPCKCSGSIKFVHQDCLMEWLSHSQKKYCELCKTPFRFTKLYDHTMPQTLPLPVFVRQLCLHGIRNIFRWIRYFLVGLVWLGWLPWSIRQVWRGLFWLADGSWGNLGNGSGNGPPPYVHDLRNSSLPVAAAPALSPNITEGLISTLPQMAAPISGFLSHSPSEFLLVKLARFLYPNLVNWSVKFVASGPSNGTAFSPIPKRQPSLLSDIRFIKTLTSYQTINNSVIDVLEGQLICLLIVTAFILIFLIREWVINQQPAADLPPVNRAEEAGIVGVGDGAFGGPARRRRQRMGEEGRQERVRRIAVPRPRRRLEATDAETEDGNTTIPEIPLIDAIPTDDDRVSEIPSPVSEHHHEDQPLQHDDESFQEASPIVRPVLRARNAFEDAASIRRTIEEGSSNSINPEWPGLDTFKDFWNRADGDPAEVLRIIHAENRQNELGWVVGKMEKLQLQKHQEPPRQAEATTLEAGDREALESSIMDEKVVEDAAGPATSADIPFTSASSDGEIQYAEREDTAISVQHWSGSSPDSWEVVEPTEALVDHSTPMIASDPADSATGSFRETPFSVLIVEDPVESAHPFTVPEASDAISQGSSDIPDHPPSTIESLADWLWRTDGYVAQVDGQLAEVDERIVEDVHQEGPFVPVPPAEVALDAEDEVEAEAEAQEEPNPEVVAAAAAAGIDLNNPEAIDDAEDLDGILELIGMQGPLAGMVQNVIFSEFLITLTLAASVWLPYIWGKIALLLLANPFGLFVRAPLHLLSNVADTAVDISLFISGTFVYVLNFGLDSLVYLASLVHPVALPWINTESIAKISLTLASGSGTRLERTIFSTVSGLKPDLPTFSVLSHQALQAFKLRVVTDLETVGQSLIYLLYEVPLRLHDCVRGGVWFDKSRISDVWCLIVSFYRQTVNNFGILYQGLHNLRSLKVSVEAPLDTSSLDYSLVRWNTQDRIIATIIGYAFFAFIGYLYIKINRLALGLKQGERVEGIVADSLSQAGEVMKVILIIGIEMIVFPLYCGLLLDVALMPLFEGVGFQSRLTFVTNAPMTALFVHWFVGTCYMFHFALFVSMCRKIMRRGVLYFIRDPDDPTFHPVRDVLERPIATQLSKIAFSGLVYGGLVILCLGGIVWVVSRVEGVFPIHWTSNEPILEFPMDLLVYNFLLPILIRTVEPSKKLNAMYEWWFRKCARWLRLTNFLFNDQNLGEQGRHVRRSWSAVLQRKQGDVMQPVVGEDRQILAEDRQLETYFLRDGRFVRAPGSDSVRIPKGGRVFLEVDENNNRKDGQADADDGPHGRKNEHFVKVYVPPMFRTRIAGFVGLIWAFAAVSGIVFTIVPLSLGRKTILVITQSGRPPNDLYAFSVGLYLCCVVAYAFSYYRTCQKWVSGKVEHYFTDVDQALPRLRSSMVYTSGLAYMAVMFGIILPFLFSTLVEIYFVAPLHTYLTSTYPSPQPTITLSVLPPTIHVVQTWTLGLVYLRVLLRIVTNFPDPQTRAATAIQSILRRGFWRPDVRLATRAFILPSLALSTFLLMMPLGLGWMINATLHEPALDAKIYRYAYPGVLGVALAFYCALLLKRQIGVWRMRIRDDVYLIGERLHNFGEAQRRQNKGKGKGRVGDRGVSERLQIR
jgi:E3 ubiquitin-protein ligase MARCH6